MKIQEYQIEAKSLWSAVYNLVDCNPEILEFETGGYKEAPNHTIVYLFTAAVADGPFDYYPELGTPHVEELIDRSLHITDRIPELQPIKVRPVSLTAPEFNK